MSENGADNKQEESSCRPSKSTLLSIKVLLSMFFVYHVAAALLLPNSSSILTKKYADFFLAYANTIGLNTTWQFFSPGPGPSFYLEYQAEMADANGEVDEKLYRYPPIRRFPTLNDSFMRRLNNLKFFSSNDDLFASRVIPYLCGKLPGAVAMHVRKVVEKIPDLEQAERRDQTVDEMAERYNTSLSRFECPSDGTVKLPRDQQPPELMMSEGT